MICIAFLQAATLFLCSLLSIMGSTSDLFFRSRAIQIVFPVFCHIFYVSFVYMNFVHYKNINLYIQVSLCFIHDTAGYKAEHFTPHETIIPFRTISSGNSRNNGQLALFLKIDSVS